jgi:Domain of unknown function (DUF4160)
MPTISMFYGIFIRMYYSPSEHPPSHFHVYYGDYSARVNIETLEIMGGEMPRKQLRLVLAWAELHQDELRQDWQRVMAGKEPFMIQPLA